MVAIPAWSGAWGVEARWMRQSLLVATLAEAGAEGVEAAVPGPTLLPQARRGYPMLIS